MTAIRQMLRTLTRAPWYALTITGVMALGMVLATSAFAVVDGVLFKPLSLPRASELVAVHPGFMGLPPPVDSLTGVSEKDLLDWSAAAPEAAFTGFRAAPWGGMGSGVNDDIAGMAEVQPNVFDVLGVRPMIGGFADADFDHAALFKPVVILYDIWQNRFRGDPAVTSVSVELDPARHAGYRIVGVMPPGFVFPSSVADVKFITPYIASASADRPRLDPRRRSFLEVVGRVPSTTSSANLRSRIESAMASGAATFPPLGVKPQGWSDAGWRREGPFDQAEVESLSRALGNRSRTLFSAVFFAALALVAVAGLNVSGLMAARTLDRRRELGVRRALGASRGSVARLVLLESIVLVVASALVALALVRPLLAFALSLLPEDVVLLKTPVIDWRVATFGLGGAMLLALPTAVWPIIGATKLTPARGWTSLGRESERTRLTGRFVVIASQVAAGVCLTIVGALLVASLATVYAKSQPIRTRGVMLVEAFVTGPSATRRKSPERTARVGPLLDRLRRVPGVSAATMTSEEILRGGGWGSRFNAPEGALKLSKTDIDLQAVTADFYRVVQPQLVTGRLPTDDELAHSERVLVVSETLARTYWPDRPALDQTLTDSDDPDPYRVIGVVKDVRWFSWDQETASIYGPYALLSRSPMLTFLIATQSRPDGLVRDLLGALHDVDSLILPKRAAMLDSLFVDSVRARRFQSWLFGSFAVAGLAILCVGILGLLAMTTARRVKEIGIRHALGATPPAIVRMIAAEQLMPVVMGLVVGGVAAVWAVQFLRSALYQISIYDARVWSAAAAIAGGTAALGVLVPAVRASRTDPLAALRAE